MNNLHRFAAIFILCNGCTATDSTEWWLVSRSDVICLKARFALAGIESPSQLAARYSGCVEEPSPDNTSVMVNCEASKWKTNYIFARTQESCEKLLEKLRPVLEKQNQRDEAIAR